MSMFTDSTLEWFTRASIAAGELSSALEDGITVSIVATVPLRVSGQDPVAGDIDFTVPVEVTVGPDVELDFDKDAVSAAVQAELDALREAAR